MSNSDDHWSDHPANPRPTGLREGLDRGGAELMARSSEFPNGVIGHVVSMTLDHTVTPSLSVATCRCGRFQNKVEWRRENHALQDAAIEAHWRAAATPRDPAIPTA